MPDLAPSGSTGGQEDLGDFRNRSVTVTVGVGSALARSAADQHSMCFPLHRALSRGSGGRSPDDARA